MLPLGHHGNFSHCADSQISSLLRIIRDEHFFINIIRSVLGLSSQKPFPHTDRNVQQARQVDEAIIRGTGPVQSDASGCRFGHPTQIRRVRDCCHRTVACRRSLLLYAITKRRKLRSGLADFVENAARAGVDRVQIREKDLPDSALYEVVRNAIARTRTTQVRVLVNGRPDIAVAAQAHGVHLPSDSLSVSSVRKVTPPGFLVGVSCHKVDEVERAASEGADFAVFGPVFDTPSKRGFGPPAGLSELERVCSAVRMPVLALGGVTSANARLCIEAGAAGLAGIGLFQSARSLGALVRDLKAIRKKDSVAE